MSKSNVFDYYELIRKQQVHYNKITNPQSIVPNHLAYKPVKAKIQQARLKQRQKKQLNIQRQNMHIMKKLCEINNRGLKQSKSLSSSNFTLPPIITKKKQFSIPEHSYENNLIAQKLIKSKSSINVKSQLKEFYEKQKLKKNISKYYSVGINQNGQEFIDRKKYLAQLMMLKKIRINEQVQSRVKSIISNQNNKQKHFKQYQHTYKQKDYYTNR